MMLLDKLQALRDRFFGSRADPQDVSSIDSWIEQAKRLLLIENLKGHDAMKYVSGIFSSEVEKLNHRLQNTYSKDMPDIERDRLLDRRDLAQKYLNLFSSVEEELKKMEENVDKES
jgi:hypothetical protein